MPSTWVVRGGKMWQTGGYICQYQRPPPVHEANSSREVTALVGAGPFPDAGKYPESKRHGQKFDLAASCRMSHFSHIANSSSRHPFRAPGSSNCRGREEFRGVGALTPHTFDLWCIFWQNLAIRRAPQYRQSPSRVVPIEEQFRPLVNAELFLMFSPAEFGRLGCHLNVWLRKCTSSRFSRPRSLRKGSENPLMASRSS